MNLADEFYLSFQIPHTGERCRGEKLLLAATLYDAMVILSHPNSRGEENRERYFETVEWFKSNSEVPFSFLWICYHLNADPRRIRKEIASGSFVKKNRRRRIDQALLDIT